MTTNLFPVGFGERMYLVPVDAVERGIGLSRAREIVRQAMTEPGVAASLRSMAQTRSFAFDIDDDRVCESVAAMIADGELVLVHLRPTEPYRIPGRSAEARREAEAPRLSDLLEQQPVRSKETKRAVTWIEIQCVGDRGESFAGAMLELRDP